MGLTTIEYIVSLKDGIPSKQERPNFSLDIHQLKINLTKDDVR